MLGLTEKYRDFFVSIGNNKDIESVLKAIVKLEYDLNKDIFHWDELDTCQFLMEFHSISPISLNSRMTVLRNFANYIAEKESVVSRSFDIGSNQLIDCIDMEKLLSLTIDYNQYMFIKNQLTLDDENVRDKLIFELAWIGLTNEQMKLIKEADVIFEPSEYGWDYAFIMSENRTIKIEDPEVVEDIKKVLAETEYIIETTSARSPVRRLKYKDSEYLLKPISVGRGKKESYMDNPGLTLKNLFNQGRPDGTTRVNTITPPDGIDLHNLTIEDIRRSKLIYLLTEENKEYFDMNLITVMFELKNDSSLYWLRKVANEKYKK